jgi:hypothetical protein
VGCAVAVRNPCHQTRGSPRHPAVTASQFCGHATGVYPHREDAGPIFLAPGRAFVQVDRVARHRPPAPVPVRLCRLRRTQTIEAAQRCTNKLTRGEDPSPCVYRKIATRLKWNGVESLGFVGGLRTTPTQPTIKEKTYFVFNDIDSKRVEGSLPSSTSTTAPPPVKFHLGTAQRRRFRVGPNYG